MKYPTLDSLNFAGKRALVRVDLNVPMADGKVTDTTRIERVLPTIREICEQGGMVILLAHFGRPKGIPDKKLSLSPVAAALQELLEKPVAFATDCIGQPARNAVSNLQPGGVLLLENTRFHPGEEANDPRFASALAASGDIYVNDAFSAAHRAHASTEGLAHRLPACAGRTMEAELDALHAGLSNPRRPLTAVVGGAKVSTKIDLLENLLSKVDNLVIGGGMANTFLNAQGKPVGKSLCENDLAETARRILASAADADCRILLPVDVVVAERFAEHAPSRVVETDNVGTHDMILDAGPRSVEIIQDLFAESATLVWNGPMGAFEIPPFDAATSALAKNAALLTRNGSLFSVAGGGDTVAALNHAGVLPDFSYVSTAGGAFLEWMEGKELPGVAALGRNGARRD